MISKEDQCGDFLFSIENTNQNIYINFIFDRTKGYLGYLDIDVYKTKKNNHKLSKKSMKIYFTELEIQTLASGILNSIVNYNKPKVINQDSLTSMTDHELTITKNKIDQLLLIRKNNNE